MPTVIDSLVVELGLDPSKFTKGQEKAVDALRKLEAEARKRGGAVEESAKGIEQGFAAVQKRMLGVAALLLGGLGIEQFIQRMTRLQVTTANVAQTFGLSSQMMQRWAAAGERIGVSGAGVAQGLQAIQQQRYNLRNFGDPSGLLALSWGTRGTSNPLNIQAPNGGLLPADQIAMALSKWLQKAGPQGASALMRMGGLSQDFVALLMQGPQKLNKLLEETKKNAPTDAEIAKWKELNDSFEKASQGATALGRKIVEDMIPGLVGFFNIVTKIAGVLAPFFGNEAKKFSSPEDAARALHEKLSTRGGRDDLHAKLAEAEKQLAATTGQLGGAKGLYRAPLLAEQQRLTEEIRKLREQIAKGGRLQNQSFIGGFGAAGDNGRLVQASFTSGGGFGGFSAPGGYGYGGGGRTGSENYPAASTSTGPLPAVPGGVIDRSRFAAELQRNPALRDKVMAIAAGENKNRSANLAVIESMMNRAAMTGTSLAYQARTTGEGGYYAGYRPGDLRNPRIRKMIEANLAAALAGSNVSNYATDNASGGLAARDAASGAFDVQFRAGGETFFSPGRRRIGHGRDRAHYDAWRRAMASEAARRAASVPLPRPRPSAGDLGALERASIDGLGAGGAGGSNSVTVGSVHIHTQATDAQGIASTIRPAIQRFAHIASVNNGPT